MGRGHARGPPDVQSRRRPPRRGPRPHVHRQLGQLLPLGHGDLARAVRPHPHPGGRRALDRHGRPVGGAGLQPARRRVGVPTAPLRAALLGRAPGGHGQDRLQRGLVRACGDPPAAAGGLGNRRLCVHAARSGGEGAPLPRLPLARHRRHRAPRISHPPRLLHPELGRGEGTARPGCRAARKERGPRHPPDGLLRGGRPRRGADPPGHGDRARARRRVRRSRRLRRPGRVLRAPGRHSGRARGPAGGGRRAAVARRGLLLRARRPQARQRAGGGRAGRRRGSSPRCAAS